MTCGACNPQAFHDPLAIERGGKLWGYTTKASPFSAVRQLYFQGAEFVLWDAPGERERLDMFLNDPVLLRPKDMLLVSAVDDLSEETYAALVDMGVRVNVLTDKEEEDEPLAAIG